MVLDKSTRSLSAVLGEVKTTNDLYFVTHYVDKIGEKETPGCSVVQSNGLTPVTILASPADNTVREVVEIIAENSDTVTHGIIVSYKDSVGPVSAIVRKASAAANQTLIYSRQNNAWGLYT